MEKLSKNIEKIVADFHENLANQLPAIEQTVEAIIEQKLNVSEDIEDLLDVLMSLSAHGIGEDVFVNLLNYYKSVNKAGAAEYERIFGID